MFYEILTKKEVLGGIGFMEKVSAKNLAFFTFGSHTLPSIRRHLKTLYDEGKLSRTTKPPFEYWRKKLSKLISTYICFHQTNNMKRITYKGVKLDKPDNISLNLAEIAKNVLYVCTVLGKPLSELYANNAQFGVENDIGNQQVQIHYLDGHYGILFANDHFEPFVLNHL